MAHKPNEYSTSDIAAVLDLPESTVRYYAQEFDNHLQVPRNRTGYRIFYDQHLSMLENIKTMLKVDGLSIKQVHQKLNGIFTQGCNQTQSPSLRTTRTINPEEGMTKPNHTDDQRIASLEKAVLMLGPLLKQLCEQHSTTAQIQQKELAGIFKEVKQIQRQLTENHTLHQLAEKENIHRVDELISAWREQQKIHQEAATALTTAQEQVHKKGLFARLFRR